MALSQTIELESGIALTYHRIEEAVFGFKPSTVPTLQVRVASYISKEARDAGKSPVKVDSVQLYLSDPLLEELGTTLNQDPRILGYKLLSMPKPEIQYIEQEDGSRIAISPYTSFTGYNGALEI